MTKKILRPYTIIPDELYIERDADRQLEHVLNEMGRPGYVLVSRQMGKTNLLLNAKRKHETPDDIFTYVDLSNPFPDARSCFRNLIDLIIETNVSKLGNIQFLIADIRKADLPEHIEHGKELRCILQAIKGRLVIILDEIDALTRSNYSDRIFAQIRSIYFERVNFADYNRLTYILSGVVDPSEIIKDPKISPFNIGQKIFLGDFTSDEVKQLSEKANLNLAEDAFTTLDIWTQGHPRITYDILSELEDVQLTGQTLLPSLIETIIRRTYLTSFDKAPVDHIREIVEKDPIIRDSILKIYTDEGHNLRDDIKRKLYLFGIINSDYELTNRIKIKNKVIELSLSSDWIKQIENKSLNLLEIALSKVQTYQYEDAIDYFVKHIETHVEEEFNGRYRFQLGFSYYKVGKYSDAIEQLQKITLDDKKRYPDLAVDTEYTLGLCYLNTNDLEKSCSHFENVITGKSQKYRYQALVNLGFAKKELGFEDEFRRVNSEVVSNTRSIKEQLVEDDARAILAVANYNLGIAELAQGNIRIAKQFFEQSFEETNRSSTKLLIKICLCEEDVNAKQQLLTQVLDTLISTNSSSSVLDITNVLRLTEDDVIDASSEAHIIGKEDLAHKIIDSAVIKYNSFSVREVLLYFTGINLINTGNVPGSLSLFRGLVERLRNNEDEYSLLLLLSSKYLSYFGKYEFLDYYISLVNSIDNLNHLGQVVNDIDFRLFAYYAMSKVNESDYGSVEKVVEKVKQLRPHLFDSVLPNYAITLYYDLYISRRTDNRQTLQLKAKELRDFLVTNKEAIQKSFLKEDPNAIPNMEALANRFLLLPEPNMPYRAAPKHLPNERITVQYEDGRIVSNIKYKKVKDDIAEQRCKIIRADKTSNNSSQE